MIPHRDQSVTDPTQQDAANTTLSSTEMKMVDERCKHLFTSVKGWISPSARMFEHRKRLKCSFWNTASRHAMPYLLHDVFLQSVDPSEDEKAKQEALDGMILLSQEMLSWTSDTTTDDGDPVPDHVLRAERIRREVLVAEKLTLFEEEFPIVDLTISLHLTLHIPRSVYEWNHVRNYWAFFSER